MNLDVLIANGESFVWTEELSDDDLNKLYDAGFRKVTSHIAGGLFMYYFVEKK